MRLRGSLVACVFVVDDEPAIAFTLTAILKLNSYDARCFTNPLEAHKAIANCRPDLLISDVVMPEMSGVDLAVRMKEECPACKVLLFSGQAQTADLLEAARQQGHDFELLAKPIHPADLWPESRTRMSWSKRRLTRWLIPAIGTCSMRAIGKPIRLWTLLFRSNSTMESTKRR